MLLPWSLQQMHNVQIAQLKLVTSWIPASRQPSQGQLRMISDWRQLKAMPNTISKGFGNYLTSMGVMAVSSLMLKEIHRGCTCTKCELLWHARCIPLTDHLTSFDFHKKLGHLPLIQMFTESFAFPFRLSRPPPFFSPPHSVINSLMKPPSGAKDLDIFLP